MNNFDRVSFTNGHFLLVVTSFIEENLLERKKTRLNSMLPRKELLCLYKTLYVTIR